MITALFNQTVVPPDTTAPTVTASPPGGDVTALPTVTLTASEPATIYYTVDGSTPTTASPVYSAPIALTGLISTLQYFVVDTVGNASAVQTQTYTVVIPPAVMPPAAWVDTTIPAAPGPSGDWGAIPAPVVPTRTPLAPLVGLTSYSITMAGVDITGQVQTCQITEAETTALSTATLEVPVGMAVHQDDPVQITFGGITREYLVSEISPAGPKRSIWCRSKACVLDAPHAASRSWNGWDTPYATAHDLATAVCGSVPLVWSVPDWNLPVRWDLTGTPIEVLQQLMNSINALVCSNPDGSITCRRRWPVRPPDMPAATPVDTVSRDTAIGTLSAKAVPGQGYGTVTVYGYDPSANLPDMEVEEQSPVIGSAVHVRLFWPVAPPPTFTTFITDGTDALMSTGTTTITEEVTFDNGVGSVKYPILKLHGYKWIGSDLGAIWRLAGGSANQLSTAAPGGRGVAEVTYTAEYQRWILTGQTAAKCIFGVDVSAGQVSATMSYTGGGSVAPAITAPLINDTAACIEAGTTFLDNDRAVMTISAETPLTATDIRIGDTLQVADQVTGVAGNGRASSITISLAPARTTRKLEVQVPC